MLNALVNANANGQKINLDEILKEVLREEIEKGVNEIIGHELTAFLGYEKSTQGAEEKFLVSLFNRYNFKVGARPIRGREYIEDELIEL